MNTLHRSENSRAKPVRKGLHPKNLHNQGYDFPALVKSHPALAPHVKPNAHGELSIDFADPLAVKTLNAALLNRHYNIVETVHQSWLLACVDGIAAGTGGGEQ